MTESASTKAMNKLMADISKIPVSKLTVRVFFDAKSRSSFCWRYFGNLLLKEGNKKKIINCDQVYCSVCLDFVKAESDDVTFGSVKVKYYNMTVSTGNLTRHLRDAHQIYESKEEPSQTRPDNHALAKHPRKAPINVRVAAQDQFELAKDLAILCCRSLIPFDAVCGEAMGDFLMKYKVVRPEDLPPMSTVTGEALTHVYEVTGNNVRKAILDDGPRHAAMEFEMWTDVTRKLDYVMFTLHYLTNDFELKSFNLSTLIITGETTAEKGERLKSMAEDVKEMFGLADKNIHVVNTAGAIETRAISLLNMPRHLCLGFGLQNLIADGVNEVQEIKQLINKFVAIVKVVVYRMNDMEAEDEAEQELLDSLCEVVDGLHYEFDDPNEQDNSTSVLIETPCLNPLEDNLAGITEIKKEPLVNIQEETENPTPKGPSIHWHNILSMTEKLMLHTPRNQVIINNILIRLAQDEIMVTPSEWVLLEELAKILTRFREAVTIISSQICTLNVALVFRSEIIDILNTNCDDESIFIFRFKRSMLSNINKRFPVSKAMVAAALLDCRFMALKEVDSYLESQNTTRAIFLASSIRECISDDEIPEIKPKPSPSSTSSSHDSSILVKLSQKHRGASLTLQDDPIEQECWRYLASADPKDPKDGDLLSFWKKRQDTFPWLSAFAKAILCIPATSAPCDSVFYGNSLTTKRSRVSPTHMNKVIFIHTNYKYCEQRSADTA